MPKLTWQNLDDIALSLYEKFPDMDPTHVRFTDLHKWITELEGFDDDEPVPDYYVWENLPAQQEDPAGDDPYPVFAIPSDNDIREPTLQVDPTSLKVHHIRGAAYTTDEFDVKRHRSTAEARVQTGAKPSDFEDLL